MSDSEILNFVVLDVNEMSQTHLDEVFAHLLCFNELGELLMQCEAALGREDPTAMVNHDFEATLKDPRSINLLHVSIES